MCTAQSDDEWPPIKRVELDYREAINQALPARVFLTGEEFRGPARPREGEFDGYPTDDLGDLDIAAIVQSIDLQEIVARHAPE